MCKILLLILGVLSLQPTHAHEDLNTVIQALSEKIKKSPTADLYYNRALEYRAAREEQHALSDFESALALQPTHQGALAQRARLYSQAENHEKALATAAKLIRLSPTPPHHLLCAELFYLAGKRDQALHHIQQAPEKEDFTHLLHAHLLQDPAQAVKVLKSGHLSTKSIVLRNAWLDTLITAGQGQSALPLIEQELSDSRFRATWLIRRARIRLQNQEEKPAQNDLHEALTELNQRLSSTLPDLTLIHDRGIARCLLGQKAAAQEDLALLKKSSFSPLSYALLETLLE